MANIPRRSHFPPDIWGSSIPREHVSFSFTVISTRNYFSQEQLTCNSLHIILAFIIPVLINLLELKYIGKGYSPFDTHPITMWAGIACLLAYCFAYGISELRFSSGHPSPIYVHALRHSMVVFGSLSLASLASILFPDSLRLYLYVLYALLSMCEFLLTLVKVLGKWIYQKIMCNLVSALHPQVRRVGRTSTYAHWLVANTSMVQRNTLPV